jgi:hypothetical protein
MFEILIAIYVIVGIFGMWYDHTRERDLTIGFALCLALIGSVIGPLVLAMRLNADHPIIIWKIKKNG